MGMMSRALSGLRPYYEYQMRAMEWAFHRVRRVSWREATPEEVVASDSSSEPKAPKGPRKSLWVILEELDEKSDVDAVGLFCDAPFVTDRPERYVTWIQVLDADHERGMLLLVTRPEEDHGRRVLYLPPSTYALEQQLRSLRKLQDKPHNAHRGLLRLVEDSDRAWWPEVKLRAPRRWAFLRNPDRPGTEVQRRFVRIAMGTPDFAILEGPPGSGKTTTICELIVQEVRLGHRVLLGASTHVAVDNVLEALERQGSTRTDVIAVRIGDPTRLSRTVRQFQLDVRANEEKEELIRDLAALSDLAPSQMYLLQALQTSDDDIITRLILESSNLVCGTTIGILQHPEIKANREEAVPQFDLLIIDEASKTLFQEFLVPALFAKRWVLVGDIRQLSPYVETTYVEGNVEALLPEQDAKACLDVFLTWRSTRDRWASVRGLVLANSDEGARKAYTGQAEHLGLSVLQLDGPQAGLPPALDILGAHVLIATEIIEPVADLLPPDVAVVPATAVPDTLTRRHNYWIQHFGGTRKTSVATPEPDSWAKEIAWRLNRSFELRGLPEKRRTYDREIEGLLPGWYPEQRKAQTLESLDLIKWVSLPSILELLQRGFGRREGYTWGTTLTDGMKEVALNQRHVLLKFQHRMHPQISRFPREYLYEHDALQDPEDMENVRAWTYSRYADRAIWLEVWGEMERGKNINWEEVDIILEELEAFLKYARGHPKVRASGEGRESWEVAILSFYRAQERALRSRLQARFQSRNRRNFRTHDRTARVELCTVDRFQGHEADLVFLSFVQNHRVGFLDSPNRLNVAITRPRYQLVLVGNRRFFERQRKSQILRDLASNLPVGIPLRKRERPSRRGGSRR